jgi:hypothetical protein
MVGISLELNAVMSQILLDAARIYDARGDEEVENKDLKTYAEFLSKEDAFTKVCATEC